MNNYILKACRRCGGDLAMDNGDWICLQCGRYAYVGLYGRPESPVDSIVNLPANRRPYLPSQKRPRPNGIPPGPVGAARGW